MPSVIEVSGLSKVYGEVKAVNGVSFSVERGEVFGMLGPNGAGKTTTMEIVEGLRSVDSGKVTVLGFDGKKESRRIKSLIGVQLQATSLYPRLKVPEVLELFGSFFDKSVPVDELIAQVGLEDSKKKLCMNLSGGQQQRLSLALAMVNDPQIMFLDEPTSGLDPQARHRIWDVVEASKKKGRTVFITTHYMEEAERLCDRVAIIDHGQVIATDKPASLVSQHFKEEAIEFQLDHEADKQALGKLAGATEVVVEDGGVTLYSKAVPTTIAALLDFARERNHELTNLYVRRAMLEDVFLKLTGKRIRD